MLDAAGCVRRLQGRRCSEISGGVCVLLPVDGNRRLHIGVVVEFRTDTVVAACELALRRYSACTYRRPPTSTNCAKNARLILQGKTEFTVHIRPTRHMDFLALVKERATSTATLPGLDAVFLGHRNCIPAAVMHLVGDGVRIGCILKDTKLFRNVVAETRRVRSYAHVKGDTHIGLVPALGRA